MRTLMIINVLMFGSISIIGFNHFNRELAPDTPAQIAYQECINRHSHNGTMYAYSRCN